MEKSHQKVLMEMRRAHKREMEMLRREKDQLLDEETKATQAGKWMKGLRMVSDKSNNVI